MLSLSLCFSLLVAAVDGQSAQWRETVLLDGAQNDWELFQLTYEPMLNNYRYGRPLSFTESETIVSAEFDFTNGGGAQMAIYTRVPPVPAFDYGACTRRQVVFTTELKWLAETSFFADLSPGANSYFVFGDDDAQQHILAGTQLWAVGGVGENWSAVPNRDFTHPYAVMSNRNNRTDCWVREARTQCIYNDLQSAKFISRFGQSSYMSVFGSVEIDAADNRMAPLHFVVDKPVRNGREALLINMTNTMPYASRPTASRWMGIGSESPLFFVGGMYTGFQLTNFTLAVRDLCTPAPPTQPSTTTTSATRTAAMVSTGQTAAADSTVSERQQTGIVLPSESLTSADGPSLSQALASAHTGTTTQATAAQPGTDRAVDWMPVDSGGDHSILIALVVLAACVACTCCLSLCYITRKRIRRSAWFRWLYHSLPCAPYIFCCCRAKMGKDDYLNDGLEIARTDEPPNGFGGLPDFVTNSGSSKRPAPQRRHTAVNEEYGTLPVTSDDGVAQLMASNDAEYMALPVETRTDARGVPTTKRLTAKEKRERRKQRKNAVNNNQYDRVVDKRDSVEYDTVYDRAPPPAHPSKTIIYDRVMGGDNRRVQSMEISDVDTDLETSNPQSQYEPCSTALKE